MQPTDKFRTDIDQALRRGGADDRARLESLRSFFYRSFPGVSEEAKASLFAAFLEKWRAEPEGAKAWLAGAGSVLFMDYDGTPFSREDWAELREAVSIDAERIDMDLLEYVMTLVLDHGAL
ncbi:MAG TPA: hypothetical protein VFL04_01570 [Rectinemataceae bacterium]|nr:hypothetical protein [Rectinemataceae bacterium]